MTSGESTPSPSSRRKIVKKAPAAKKTPREKELEKQESEELQDAVVPVQPQESDSLEAEKPSNENTEVSAPEQPAQTETKKDSSKKNFYDANGKQVFYRKNDNGFESVHVWTERRQEFTETKLHTSEEEAEEWCLNRVPVA